jgi:hypothetical protein
LNIEAYGFAVAGGGQKMDDRINAGLLFVLLDRQKIPNEAADKLAGIPGIQRISWWANVCPNRTDWLGKLRTLEEFETLGICELGQPIDPGLIPHDLRVIQFNRYPRPSQGVLRPPTLGLCVVLISPKELDDQESAQSLRDWADFIHFPGIVDANIPGYGLVTPYENVAHSAPRFLHLYEFPDRDAEAVFQRTRPCVAQRFGGGPGHPSFDRWELHPQIAINYVNSFQLMERDRVAS